MFQLYKIAQTFYSLGDFVLDNLLYYTYLAKIWHISLNVAEITL